MTQPAEVLDLNLHGFAVRVVEPLQPAEMLGAAVVLGGFSDGRKHPFATYLSSLLAANNILAISFDPIGLWDSIAPGEQEKPELYTQEFYQEQIGMVVAGAREIMDIMNFSGKLALGGYCYGGYSALHNAARNSDVDLVFAVSPTRDSIWSGPYLEELDTKWRVADDQMRRFTFHDRTGRPRLGLRFLGQFLPDLVWPKIMRDVPYSLVENERNFDLRDILPDIHQPVLFIAPTKDDLISSESVDESFDACGSQDRELSHLPLNHDLFDNKRRTRLANMRVLDFLLSHMRQGQDRLAAA